MSKKLIIVVALTLLVLLLTTGTNALGPLEFSATPEDDCKQLPYTPTIPNVIQQDLTNLVSLNSTGDECEDSPPILVDPPNGSSLDTLIPDFRWERVTAVPNYNLEVSTSPEFPAEQTELWGWYDSNPSSNDPISAPSWNNLQANTSYYWRVSSHCPNGRVPSEVYLFRSAPPGGVILPAPQIIAPDDGAEVGSIIVNQIFEQIEGAIGYQFRWNEQPTENWDSGFERGTITYFSKGVYPAWMQSQKNYFWQMAARNDYAWGVASQQRSFTTPITEASSTITPDQGGILSPPPDNVTIQFPPGAVSQPTTIDYELLPYPTHALNDLHFGGRALSLTASDSSGPVETFLKPFTLTVRYDNADLFAKNITNPSNLNIVYWTGQDWEPMLPCDGCWNDIQTNTIEIVVDHLTEFVLVAPDEKSIYLPIITGPF